MLNLVDKNKRALVYLGSINYQGHLVSRKRTPMMTLMMGMIVSTALALRRKEGVVHLCFFGARDSGAVRGPWLWIWGVERRVPELKGSRRHCCERHLTDVMPMFPWDDLSLCFLPFATWLSFLLFFPRSTTSLSRMA